MIDYLKQSLASKKINSAKISKLTPYLTTYPTTSSTNLFCKLLVDLQPINLSTNLV